MAKREIESVPLSRFGVLVAQLESIVASARQQPLDALLCFDLLSDLVSALEEEPKASVVLWQRKCEDALYSLLILGARRPVRRLASAAMVRVIAKGDGISIYSRASTLQGWLADGKRSEPLSCAGAAQCLGELYRLFGRRITSGLLETTNITAKLLKFHEDFVRQDALQMLENALEGSGASGAPTAYSEAFRIIIRVSVSDKSFIVRLAAARCLKSFASIGGPGLGITELESSIIYCIKALEDPVSSVRDAFAEALGALLALAMYPEAQVRQRGKNHPIPAKKLEDGLQKHLISPFIRASGLRAKDLRIGLALSWVFFLQVVRLKYDVPDFELQNYALEAMNMLQGNASVDAHALACVLYILRVGVSDQMTEPTQRIFLVLLGKKLESADFSPSVGVTTLRILSYLLTTLGEVPIEFKDILDNTVVAALSHSSLHVRIEAALTLRSLAEIDPTCVGGLISYGVTTLHALRESASIEKGDHLNLELYSLHGQAIVLAALVSISPKLLLGYPARLPKSVFEVSKKMLTEFSRNSMAATVEKEAGWLLLASLIASMPKEELEDQVFDVLLLWADPFVGNPELHIRHTHDMTSEMLVLSAAIEALTAFIRSFISPIIAATNAGILLQPVLAYLRGALSYISYLTGKELQNLKPSLDLFIIRTLMAYQSISDTMAYRSEHPQILQICTTLFSDPSRCEESSCLRSLLDKRDSCLGPWIPGRDWFEDELRAFDGGKDGLMPSVWDDELCSFPQPEPISKILVNQKLLCFATIFASQDNGGKLILLNQIDQCLKSGKKQPWHVASITNACVGLLAGLKAVLALRPQSVGVEVLSSVQSIFQDILAEGDICSGQRRASSEAFGLLARLGSDIFTARMTRSLLGELAVATDPTYMGSIAFTLGCIHRSAGGMALSTLVPATVSSVSLLAKSSNADLQLWSLHALLLTIEAAGLSYVSQVQATLFLAIEILLSEEKGLIDLRQEIGHLINAIVAVLGPELSPGSTFFSRCKSVIAEISSCQETSTLLESVRFTQQLVLFAPQAVSVHCHVQSLLPTLSSRQPSLRYLAVSTLRHLIEKDPMLLIDAVFSGRGVTWEECQRSMFIFKSQFGLSGTYSDSPGQLDLLQFLNAQNTMVAMIDEKIEESLFRMLDEETDTEIGSLVRTTITGLLYTSCPSCPSRWLALCHNMILATSTSANAESDRLNGISEGDAKLHYGEDDEDMIASSYGERVQSSGFPIYGVYPRRDKHLRYRTRVFAAECLSYLPTAVGTDPAHFDISVARTQPAHGRTPSGDWLVLHLQELVSLSYQISTCQFEGMQPIGVRLLSIIMDKFEKIPDPEFPGHLLLEQYQAQLVSAVRSAISTTAGPLLLEAGLQLATKILTSSIIGGDRVALNRMFSVISRPLNDIKDLYYPSFAEWVACKIKVRLLAAHASIKCYVYQFVREQNVIPDEYLQLTPLFSSSSAVLGKYWISVLKDYSYICFGLHSKLSYIPFLDGIQSPLVSSKVQKCLDEAWPLILQAIVFDAVPVKFEIDKCSNNTVEDLPKTSFLSGYSMVRLELREFEFLWGLALLIMFQGQQVEVGKHVKPLLAHRKMKHNGDLMLQGTHDWMLCEIALPVFESLSREVFFNHKFLTFDICRDLLKVLIYADHMADAWNGLVIGLLSQVVQLCPDDFFEKEDFTAVVMELCLKHLFITFQSDDATSQGYPSSKDPLSELSIVAKRIVCRMNHKNHWTMKLAFMSVCYEWFRGASINLSLSKVIVFLRNVASSQKCFPDEADPGIDDYIHVEKIRGAWMCMLTFLSQDCIRRIHTVENKMGDSSKLLVKILAFCLEEAVALARLVHETLNFRQNKDTEIFMFAILKNCIKCIRDTFYDSNIQVQTVGLYVLKSIAQRDLTEGSHVKNHFFSLFFAGELFGDMFLLIQHTLKENISRESIAVTGECLRLLFLFHTLSQTSECLRAVTMLLLEALLMVFSVSNEKNSPELNEAKTTARRLVSHLVQNPSSAVQIKDAMLSMAVTRRLQFQDMIRDSVGQGQMAMQVKLNVQSEPNAREYQLHASDSTVESADKQDSGKEDGHDDDDDDWDAFQSFPAKNTSASTLDSNVDRSGSDLASVGEVSNKDYSKYPSVPHITASVEVSDAQNPVTYIGDELTGKVELEEPSDPQHSKDDGIIQNEVDSNAPQVSDPYQPAVDSKNLIEDRSTEEGGEVPLGFKIDDDHPGRTDDDEDGSYKYSVLASPEDDEKESDDQHLHHEGNDEPRTEGDKVGSHTHHDDPLSALKSNEKETDDRRYSEGGSELRSGGDGEGEGHQKPSGDSPESPRDP